MIRKTTTARDLASMALFIALMFVAGGMRAEPISLPSDEEMLKQGRESLNKSMSQFDSATPSMGKTVPLNIPPVSTQKMPLGRDLAKELFSYDLKKTSSDSKGTELIIFVSFSMPDDELREYSRQAKEAGAIIVLRGMWQASVTKTQQKAYSVNHALAQWDINPGVYRKFKVDRVPVIILADVTKSQVVEDGCAVPDSYLRVDGGIAVRQALLLMRQRGEGALANDAANRLAKLEAPQK